MEEKILLVAVLDACVLYPAPVRDYLLYLAGKGIYQPKWSKEINDEWVRNLLLNRKDIPKEKLDKTILAMNTAFPDADIAKDDSIIKLLVLPDLDDRHVLATAIKSKAERIITANLKDFPISYVKQFDISIQHPDYFIHELLEKHPDLSLSAFEQQVNNLKNPPMSVSQVLKSFQKCGLVHSVQKLEHLLDKKEH